MNRPGNAAAHDTTVEYHYALAGRVAQEQMRRSGHPIGVVVTRLAFGGGVSAEVYTFRPIGPLESKPLLALLYGRPAGSVLSVHQAKV